MPKKLIVILLAIAALPVLGIKPTHAQQATWLTEENVRAYMHRAETMHQKSFDEYVATLNEIIHDDFQSQIKTTLHVPNESPREVPMSMDKKSMISSAREGYDGSQGATLEQTIDSIEITTDKKSATVKSTTKITGQKLADGNSMQTSLADSLTVCTDELVYTPLIGVQTIKSDCQSDVTMKVEQEL